MSQLTKYAKLLFLYYLRFCAQIQLKKNNPHIIGVTGSAGKTSTLFAVESVLESKFRIKVAKKANSETGIPLNILGIQMKNYSLIDWIRVTIMAIVQLLINWERYDYYIVEMGINSPNWPNNMQYLLSIINPHTGVYLNAHAVHSENFDYLVQEANPKIRQKEITSFIAHEKGKLITSLNDSDTAIVNIDDENAVIILKETISKVITIGYSQEATIQIVKVDPTTRGTWFGFRYADSNHEFILAGVALGKAYGHTLAAAISVGISLGMTIEESIEELKKNFKVPESRMNIFKGIGDSLIIDSSYNSSLIPIIDALNVLDQIEGSRKIVILGDMREMGQESELAHSTAAKYAVNICDQIILVGPLMKQYALPILGDKATYAKNAKVVSDILKDHLKKDDVVLIKGSQNTLYLEYTVEQLLKDKTDAKKLCRRGDFWDKKRQEVGLA